MKLIKTVLALIAGIFVIIYSSIWALTGWWLLFIPKYKRYRYADVFMVLPWTFSINYLILFIRLKVLGKENVDKKRTSLYICNHQSWIDIQIFVRHSHATGVAKKEVMQIPFIGILIKYAGALLFDRNAANSRTQVIKEMITYFRNGSSLCLYPEGTRSRDGSILEPNLTTLKLCFRQNIPVVPAAIEGTRNILKRGSLLFNFFQKVVLKYNTPMYPKDFANDEEFAKACWEKVRSTHAEILETYFSDKKLK